MFKKIKNNLMLFFIANCLLVFACIIPGATVQVQKVNEQLPTILPTVLATEIPFSKCLTSEMANKELAIVNAFPDGLRIREAPNGKELAIIPHQSSVFILSEDANGWTIIGFMNDDGTLICGYSASRYLYIAN